MNTAFSELEKSMLDQHYKRFLSAHRNFKSLQLRYLWDFLQQSELFAPLCARLDKNAVNELDLFRHQIVDKLQPFSLHESFIDRVRLIYLVVGYIATNRNLATTQMYKIGKIYLAGNTASEEEQFGVFNLLFVDPLIAWFQTNIDKNLVILDQLRKYAYAAEWFNTKSLNNLFEKDSTHGEALLSADLYGYLYEKGVHFQLEPKSPAGRLDYIGAQENARGKILIETKVFGAGRGKEYIIQGFHQLHTYTRQYNEIRGYLVIYNISPDVLVIKSGTDENGIPFHTSGNVAIYFIVINVWLHEKPASKRPPTRIVEIKASDLVPGIG